MDIQQVGRESRHGHALQIIHGVVTGIGEELGVDRIGHAVKQQRVAVSRGVHHPHRGNIAARAGLVLYDHGLPQGRSQLLAEQPCHDVG